MSVWKHDYNRLSGDILTGSALSHFWSEVHHTKTCPFCKDPLDIILKWHTDDSYLRGKYLDIIGNSESRFKFAMQEVGVHEATRSKMRSINEHFRIVQRTVKTCQCCGWWIAFKDGIVGNRELHAYGGVGALKALDLNDVSLPVQEVRDFLTANYKARFAISPRVFEETVASVFRDLGYSARVTAYSGDDGIDVILDGPENVTIGIQVKRYRNSINVGQIREFTGALVINGITKGIFVTTSDFQSGADRTAKKSELHGYPIELINSERFYDAMKLAQRERYESSDDRDGAFPPHQLLLIYRHTLSESDSSLW